MQLTPRAMLSRAVSVIRDDTLIVNLPGSPKAVKECLDFLLDNIDHGLMMLRGEADG
jgi:molybdopterin biosynthesis enzyme MoaB